MITLSHAHGHVWIIEKARRLSEQVSHMHVLTLSTEKGLPHAAAPLVRQLALVACEVGRLDIVDGQGVHCATDSRVLYLKQSPIITFLSLNHATVGEGLPLCSIGMLHPCIRIAPF